MIIFGSELKKTHMKHGVKYAFLGMILNSLADEGRKLDLQKTHEYVRNRTIFKWLKSQFGDDLNLSLYADTELQEIASFFEEMSLGIDEDIKWGITNNGLCLLTAYCFEAIQRGA